MACWRSRCQGDGYRRMIQACPAGCAGTADEVAALLMGPDAAFLHGDLTL
ncbi:MAG: hypothetical protein ACXIUZ_05565 [Lysobacteraceae bacterium]